MSCSVKNLGGYKLLGSWTTAPSLTSFYDTLTADSWNAYIFEVESADASKAFFSTIIRKEQLERWKNYGNNGSGSINVGYGYSGTCTVIIDHQRLSFERIATLRVYGIQ